MRPHRMVDGSFLNRSHDDGFKFPPRETGFLENKSAECFNSASDFVGNTYHFKQRLIVLCRCLLERLAGRSFMYTAIDRVVEVTQIEVFLRVFSSTGGRSPDEVLSE